MLSTLQSIFAREPKLTYAPGQYSLFISYSRREAPFVDHLLDHLEDLGFPAWLDYHSLVLARPWQEQIFAGIDGAGIMLLVQFAFACAVWRWSGRATWSARHRLSIAAGLLLTYVWYGFVQAPSVGDIGPTVDRLGDVVFGLGAIALLRLAFHRVDRSATANTNARGI